MMIKISTLIFAGNFDMKNSVLLFSLSSLNVMEVKGCSNLQNSTLELDIGDIDKFVENNDFTAEIPIIKTACSSMYNNY